MQIGLQLINGLKYLKSVGIVHCNLSPDNILITDNYNYKIGGFGRAILIEEF